MWITWTHSFSDLVLFKFSSKVAMCDFHLLQNTAKSQLRHCIFSPKSHFYVAICFYNSAILRKNWQSRTFTPPLNNLADFAHVTRHLTTKSKLLDTTMLEGLLLTLEDPSLKENLAVALNSKSNKPKKLTSSNE